MRVCLSFAIAPMSEEFNWDSSVKGYALSSFFFGYIFTQVIFPRSSVFIIYHINICTSSLLFYSILFFNINHQIPGGWLAERYGGKYVIGLGTALTGVLTLITPVVVKFGHIESLIVLRILVIPSLLFSSPLLVHLPIKPILVIYNYSI